MSPKLSEFDHRIEKVLNVVDKATVYEIAGMFMDSTLFRIWMNRAAKYPSNEIMESIMIVVARAYIMGLDEAERFDLTKLKEAKAKGI